MKNLFVVIGMTVSFTWACTSKDSSSSSSARGKAVKNVGRIESDPAKASDAPTDPTLNSGKTSFQGEGGESIALADDEKNPLIPDGKDKVPDEPSPFAKDIQGINLTDPDFLKTLSADEQKAYTLAADDITLNNKYFKFELTDQVDPVTGDKVIKKIVPPSTTIVAVVDDECRSKRLNTPPAGYVAPWLEQRLPQPTAQTPFTVSKFGSTAYPFGLKEDIDLAVLRTNLQADPCLTGVSFDSADSVVKTYAVATGNEESHYLQQTHYQEGLALIKSQLGDVKVKIAILDSGIDLKNSAFPVHEHFKELAPAEGFGSDYVSGGDVPQDEDGHGSMVASIIGATENATGVLGLAAGNVTLIPYRMNKRPHPSFDLYNSKTELTHEDINHPRVSYKADLYNGIKAAINLGVDVINLSIGNLSDEAFCDPILGHGIWMARRLGTFIVMAAGNSLAVDQDTGGWIPRNMPMIERVGIPKSTTRIAPACWGPTYYGAITVGGVNSNDMSYSQQSNWGTAVEFLAPQSSIPAIGLNGVKKVVSGSSMAAAQLSAAAALSIAFLKNNKIYSSPWILEYILQKSFRRTSDKAVESKDVPNFSNARILDFVNLANCLNELKKGEKDFKCAGDEDPTPVAANSLVGQIFSQGGVKDLVIGGFEYQIMKGDGTQLEALAYLGTGRIIDAKPFIKWSYEKTSNTQADLTITQSGAILLSDDPNELGTYVIVANFSDPTGFNNFKSLTQDQYDSLTKLTTKKEVYVERFDPFTGVTSRLKELKVEFTPFNSNMGFAKEEGLDYWCMDRISVGNVKMYALYEDGRIRNVTSVSSFAINSRYSSVINEGSIHDGSKLMANYPYRVTGRYRGQAGNASFTLNQCWSEKKLKFEAYVTDGNNDSPALVPNASGVIEVPGKSQIKPAVLLTGKFARVGPNGREAPSPFSRKMDSSVLKFKIKDNNTQNYIKDKWGESEFNEWEIETLTQDLSAGNFTLEVEFDDFTSPVDTEVCNSDHVCQTIKGPKKIVSQANCDTSNSDCIKNINFVIKPVVVHHLEMSQACLAVGNTQPSECEPMTFHYGFFNDVENIMHPNKAVFRQKEANGNFVDASPETQESDTTEDLVIFKPTTAFAAATGNAEFSFVQGDGSPLLTSKLDPNGIATKGFYYMQPNLAILGDNLSGVKYRMKYVPENFSADFAPVILPPSVPTMVNGVLNPKFDNYTTEAAQFPTFSPTYAEEAARYSLATINASKTRMSTCPSTVITDSDLSDSSKLATLIKDDYYLVCDSKQFIYAVTHIESGGIKLIKLGDHLDFSIGVIGIPFESKLPLRANDYEMPVQIDGNGYEVRNLKLTDGEMSTGMGLFMLCPETVSHLGIRGFELFGGSSVGALAGTCRNGQSYTDIYVVDSKIQGMQSASHYKGAVGGLVGWVMNSPFNQIRVINTHVSAKQNTKAHVGGIIGALEWQGQPNASPESRTLLKNSFVFTQSKAEINAYLQGQSAHLAPIPTGVGLATLGGLVGWVGDTNSPNNPLDVIIANVFYRGYIQGQLIESMGGIVGLNRGTIHHSGFGRSVEESDIECISCENVGGIVGFNWSRHGYDDHGLILDTTFIGKLITSSSGNVGGITGDNWIGTIYKAKTNLDINFGGGTSLANIVGKMEYGGRIINTVVNLSSALISGMVIGSFKAEGLGSGPSMFGTNSPLRPLLGVDCFNCSNGSGEFPAVTGIQNNYFTPSEYKNNSGTTTTISPFPSSPN